ncbi:MAG: ABC transporter permease [Actinomycetia bacterium]|nr:ABC transporter permease [Actinomycetes bacterium]
MIGAIRSEFLKFFTTRLWWGMAAGIFVAGAVFAVIFGFVFTLEGMTGTEPGMPSGDATQIASSVYTGGLGVGYLLLLTIGVLHVGAEYRHKTITSTFLSTPRRVKALLAKAIALVGISVLYGLLSLLGSVALGAVILTVRGFEAFPSATIVRTLALGLVVLAMWALIGLGVGILIPNQVAALLIAVGVAWIVEPLVSVALNFWSWGAEHIAPFLPTAATNAMINTVTMPGEVRLQWWGGLIVLASYALVLAGLGIWRASREDIG